MKRLSKSSSSEDLGGPDPEEKGANKKPKFESPSSVAQSRSVSSQVGAEIAPTAPINKTIIDLSIAVSYTRGDKGLTVNFGNKKNLQKYIERRDDPALILEANTDSIGMMLDDINQQQPLLPQGFPAYPWNQENFKQFVLHKIADIAVTSGGVVGNFMIAPNTISELSNLASVITTLNYDPFFRNLRTAAIGNAALFTVWTVHDKIVHANATRVVIAPCVPLPVFV
jgi:hypothetical protein